MDNFNNNPILQMLLYMAIFAFGYFVLGPILAVLMY